MPPPARGCLPKGRWGSSEPYTQCFIVSKYQKAILSDKIKEFVASSFVLEEDAAES